MHHGKVAHCTWRWKIIRYETTQPESLTEMSIATRKAGSATQNKCIAVWVKGVW